ncbi:hypothetical protein MUP59_01940, partial [Candidatus Bathyarchaeota archaeon]|nr:hypothetical protein [Candidatus Bathyarchaeota archaeon]
MSRIPPQGFNKIIGYYARNNRIPINLSILKNLVGDRYYQSNIEFIIQNDLGSVQTLSQDVCE